MNLLPQKYKKVINFKMNIVSKYKCTINKK